MCGVAAVYSPSRRGADVDVLVHALRHRGPDAAGTWAAPSGRAALGHTRLAIVDLLTGDQPIENEERTAAIVVSGELYGHREIRAELERRGHVFRTRSDSEIALHLYEDEGERALERLRGEFALVVWDETRGELFAARDRFGIKPLFYAWRDGSLYLASEAKALFAAGVAMRWDVDAFGDYLNVCFGQDRSLFDGVRQVPPGHVLRARGGAVEIAPYWDVDYPRAEEVDEPSEGFDAHCERLREALADALLVRLEADVPVGFHLSGGLDSSSLVGLAARHVPVSTFTVSFDDPEYDEGPLARLTAGRVGASHHEIPFARADFGPEVVGAIRSGEMIQENSHGLARLVQSRAIHEARYKVVIGGEGGDEAFAGYPQLQKDLAFTRSAAVREQARTSYERLARLGMPRHLRSLVTRLGFVPNWILDRYLNVTLPVSRLLRDEVAARLVERDCLAPLLDDPRVAAQLEGRTALHQSLYLFWKTWLCNYILAAERLDMAYALEVRLPFLDHRLFDVAKRTPIAWYADGDATKLPLREAMRRFLVDEVYRGEKRPFFAPPAIEADAVLAVLAGLVRGEAMHANPFFDPARTRAFLARVVSLPPGDRRPYEPVLQIVACVCALGEIYGLADAA